MSLLVVPANFQSNAYLAGISLPYMVGFAIEDNGAGGNLFLNGQGAVDPTVTDAVDLKTIFTSAGLLFRSIPLLQAFRKIYTTPPSDPKAETQFQNALHINIFPVSNTGSATAGLPVVRCVTSLVGADASIPYLEFSRPLGEGALAGLWRIELTYKHSVTN